MRCICVHTCNVFSSFCIWGCAKRARGVPDTPNLAWNFFHRMLFTPILIAQKAYHIPTSLPIPHTHHTSCPLMRTYFFLMDQPIFCPKQTSPCIEIGRKHPPPAMLFFMNGFLWRWALRPSHMMRCCTPLMECSKAPAMHHNHMQCSAVHYPTW